MICDGECPGDRAEDIVVTKDIHPSTEEAGHSPELFDQLVDSYAEEVYRFLASRCPSRMDAEDMTQETYLLALHNLSSLHDERKAKQWLFSIAHNVARQHHRRGRCRPEAPQDHPREGSASGDAMNEDVLRRLAIGDALASLSEDHQTILLLVAQVRLTIVEASFVLNIGIEAAKKRWQRACRNFRLAFESEHGP
jgi:RNA polymerase sigma-70 factor (ECF subfamily)